MNIDDLKFEAVPVKTPAEARLRVALRAKGAISISMNAEAFEKLDLPAALNVKAARGDDGACFLRIESAVGDGWPVIQRKPKGGGRPGAICEIKVHPFSPGVVHRAQDVDTIWADRAAVLAMPDWRAMLAEFEAD